MNESDKIRQMKRRLLLEDVCSDVIRYLHAEGRPDAHGNVQIDREWNLGITGAFADMRVVPASGEPYFVEIKTDYTASEVVEHLAAKYSRDTERLRGVRKVVVVLETRGVPNREALVAAIRRSISPSLSIELWDEERVDEYARRLFGVAIRDFSDEEGLVHLRYEIDEAKARLAFGTEATDSGAAVLRRSLLWHFGVWHLRELRQAAHGSMTGDELVRPGHFERAIVLICDLSSFSSFVRDTPDEDVVRASLTSFYSKARYQVINAGGMLYQFVGDEVSAIFGVPDQRPGYVVAALDTACALLEIGRSVTFHWQKRIDRVQPNCAAHIGMAMGDLDLVAQRPFDVSRVGAFGDCLNVAARLAQAAGPDEILISNVLRSELSADAYACEERPTLDLKNFGPVRSWRLVTPMVAMQDPLGTPATS